MTVAVLPAVLSLSVANGQSYVTVSGQVSLYQTLKVLTPLGAVKVWEMVLSPLVGVVLPSSAQKVPLWQPALTTVSDAPAAVQPLSVPVSKPPFTIPSPPGAVTVTVTVVVCVTVPSVPLTVTL